MGHHTRGVEKRAERRAAQACLTAGWAALAAAALTGCGGAAGPRDAACADDRRPAIVTLVTDGDTAAARDTVLRDVFGADGYLTRPAGAACPDRPLLGETFQVSGGFEIQITDEERARLERHRLVSGVAADQISAPHSR